jgi:GTPase SAR1 family protein
MAEAAASGNVPTFKLVLVGDGGTGKVCTLLSTSLHS